MLSKPKTKKRRGWWLGLVFALGLFSAACCHAPGHKVCVKGRCFSVELARTDQERSQGLMFRESLGHNQGMLFLFDEERPYPFWMKNTRIPLDIIWIDKNKKVVFIKRDARPCTLDECETIYPLGKAMYVLELNAGVADEIKLNPGDSLQFTVE